MKINFFIFCMPIRHDDFFHICMILNSAICLLGLTFIFNSSFSIISIGLICFINIGVTMNSLYSFYETQKINLKANKIYSVGQIPLWGVKVVCFALFRQENFKSKNIYTLIAIGIVILLILSYYIWMQIKTTFLKEGLKENQTYLIEDE